MPNIDLSGITFAQFAIVLVAAMLVDFASGVIGALATHTFSVDKLLDIVTTHLLPRVFPIGALGWLAWSLNGIGDAFTVVWGSALALLAGYLIETIASVTSNLTSGSTTPAK